MVLDILRIKLQGKCILDNLSKESNLVKVGLCALMAVCILGKFWTIYHMGLGSYSMWIKINMLEILMKEWGKEVAIISIVKALFLEGCGQVIRRLKENSHYSMEIYLKVNSEIIWDIMVCTGIKMGTPMKAHGKTILNKVLVNWS